MRAGQLLDARQRLGLDRAELGEVDAPGSPGCPCRPRAPPRPARRRPFQEAQHVVLGDAALLAGALHLVRSTPSSRATRRTLGLAWTLPKSAPARSWRRPAIGRGRGLGRRRIGGHRCRLGCGGGSCWVTSEGGWVMAPSPPLNVRIGVPSLTLSPTLTRIFSTVPAGRRRHLHGRLVGFQREQRILGVDRVARLDQDLDDRNVLEVADVGHVHLDVVPVARASVMAVIVASVPVSDQRVSTAPVRPSSGSASPDRCRIARSRRPPPPARPRPPRRAP